MDSPNVEGLVMPDAGGTVQVAGGGVVD